MGFGDLLDRMLGRAPATPDEERMVLPAPPTAEDVYAALDQTAELLASSALPSAASWTRSSAATCRTTRAPPWTPRASA